MAVELNAPTITPPDLIVDNIESWWEETDDDVHVECCSKALFLCGAEYHPEAATHDPTEDACEACIEVIDQGRCPPFRPTHFHCPLMERKTGLWLVCEGPKRRR